MSESVPIDEGAVFSAEFRPGRALAEARKRKSLSVTDVALQLRLSVSQVEALEADAYDRLPGAVFVRGFVRNYARLVDLDADELVAGLDLERLNLSAMVFVQRSSNIPLSETKKIRRLVYLAVLLLLIVVVVFVDPLISALPVVVVSKPVAQAVPDMMAVPKQAAVTLEKNQFVSDPVTQALQSPAPAAGQTVAVDGLISGRGELHFVINIESWVEVRDAGNRILLSQLNPSGVKHHVKGRPPFSLVIGNARGVQLTYNGKLVDLAPHTRFAVARLTLK